MASEKTFKGEALALKKQLVNESIVGQGRTWQELHLFSPKLEEIGKRDNTRLDPVFPVDKFLLTYLPFFNFPRSPGRILVISFLCGDSHQSSMSIISPCPRDTWSQEFERPFRLSEEEEPEFRVYTYNRRPFWADRIQVIQDR